MIEQFQTIYYLFYGVLSIIIGIVYLKIKSTEGVTITTNEFKLFQSGFLSGYCLMILGELMTTASFFHTFVYLKLSVYDVTKLYVVTATSTTVFSIILEIFEIGSRKSKCILSAGLYLLSLLSVFFGGHVELLLLGRVVYGAASAMHHTVFDSYLIHEHTSQGFPDDWLTQTFSHLTHGMSLISVLSGILGQTANTSAPLGTVALCCIIFLISMLYISIVWNKDNFNGSKFMLSPFLQNMSNTLRAGQSNKQIQLLLGITCCCESAIMIFTYYWAPWMYSLISPESGHSLPYELIFSTFIICSMVSNYLYQLYASDYGYDSLFQMLLIIAAGAFILGSMFQTTSMAYIISLVVQVCAGAYWPSIGALRGRIIMPELRSSIVTLSKIITLIITSTVLITIHYNSFLTLSVCAVLFGAAAYFQMQLTQQGTYTNYTENDLDYEHN